MKKTSFLALLGKKFPEKLSGLSVKGGGTGTTMQVNVEACPYLHYQIQRSKSTRSNTVWPSGGSAQWQIFIGGANRRSIHGGEAAWAGNSIAKEGPFNCAELRSRKGIPLKRE